jgi:hypothetical protein
VKTSVRAWRDSNPRPAAQKLSPPERCSHQRKRTSQPSVIAKVICSPCQALRCPQDHPVRLPVRTATGLSGWHPCSLVLSAITQACLRRREQSRRSWHQSRRPHSGRSRPSRAESGLLIGDSTCNRPGVTFKDGGCARPHRAILRPAPQVALRSSVPRGDARFRLVSGPLLGGQTRAVPSGRRQP